MSTPGMGSFSNEASSFSNRILFRLLSAILGDKLYRQSHSTQHKYYFLTSTGIPLASHHLQNQQARTIRTFTSYTTYFDFPTFPTSTSLLQFPPSSPFFAIGSRCVSQNIQNNSMLEQLGDTLWLDFLFLNHYDPHQGCEVELQNLLNHMVRIHFLDPSDREDYTQENLDVVAQFLQYIHHAFDYFLDFHYDTLVEAHNNLQSIKVDLQEKLEYTAEQNGKLQEHIEQLLTELSQQEEEYLQQMDASRSNIEKQQEQLQSKDEEKTLLQREVKDAKRRLKESEIENHRLKRVVDTLTLNNMQLNHQKHSIQHYQQAQLQFQHAIDAKNAEIANLYSDVARLQLAIHNSHTHITQPSRVQFVSSGQKEEEKGKPKEAFKQNRHEVAYGVISGLQFQQEEKQSILPSARRISQEIGLTEERIELSDQINYELKRSQQNFSVAESGTIQGKSRSKKYIEIVSSESINPKYRNINFKNRELLLQPLVFSAKKQDRGTVRQTKTQRDMKNGKQLQTNFPVINQLKSERIHKDYPPRPPQHPQLHPPETPSRKNGSIQGKDSMIRNSECNQTLSKRYQETGREAKPSKLIAPNYNDRLKYSPSNETLLKGPKRQRFMELLSQQREIEQLQSQNNSLKEKIIFVEEECEALFEEMQAHRQCLREYETQFGREHQQLAQYQSRIRQCEGQLLDYRQRFREQTTKYALLKNKCKEQFKKLTEKHELKVDKLEEFIELNLSEKDEDANMLKDSFENGLHQANKAMQREKRMNIKNYQRSNSCVQVNKKILHFISGTMIRESINEKILILTNEDYTDAFDENNADSSSIRIHESEGQDMLEKSEEKQERQMEKLERSLNEYIQDEPHQFWNKLTYLISSKEEINQTGQNEPEHQNAEQINTAESTISLPLHLASKTVSYTVAPLQKLTCDQSVQTSASSKQEYGINTVEQRKRKNTLIQTPEVLKKSVSVQVNSKAKKTEKRVKRLKIQPVINQFIPRTVIASEESEILRYEKCDQIEVKVEQAKNDQNSTDEKQMAQTMIDGLKWFPLSMPKAVFLQNSLDIGGKLELIDTLQGEEWRGGRYFDEYVPSRMYIIEGESTGIIQHFVLWGSRLFQFGSDRVSQLFMEKHNAIRIYDDKFVNLGNGEVRIEEMQLVIARQNGRNYFYGDIQDGKWSILKLHVYGLQLP